MQLRTADEITAFIIADPRRWAILDAVRRQRLPDWAVAAGFIRSAVWDALHGYAEPTPIADVDVLFFDADDVTRERECAIEAALAEAMPGVPWSVKNQARMHRRDGDAPYADTADALRFWLETPTESPSGSVKTVGRCCWRRSAPRIWSEWYVVRRRAAARGCRSTISACTKGICWRAGRACAFLKPISRDALARQGEGDFRRDAELDAKSSVLC